MLYSHRQDALAGVKSFNNVQLDGKPIKVEIVLSKIVTPTVPFSNGVFGFGDTNGVPRMYDLLLTKLSIGSNFFLRFSILLFDDIYENKLI